MKIKIFIISLAIMVAGPLCISKAALAARGCADGTESSSYITVYKTAPGTKYNATLTVYYTQGISCADTTNNLKNMHFFLRMEGNVLEGGHDYGGQEYLSFGDVAECIPYWEGSGYSKEEAVIAQQVAIEEFFKLVAVPYIYSCDALSSDPDQACPPAKVKSISKIVEDNMASTSPIPDPMFLMMDLIIAIDDKP